MIWWFLLGLGLICIGVLIYLIILHYDLYCNTAISIISIIFIAIFAFSGLMFCAFSFAACPKCSAFNAKDGSSYCYNCGYNFPTKAHCNHCNMTINTSENYCKYCGAETNGD